MTNKALGRITLVLLALPAAPVSADQPKHADAILRSILVQEAKQASLNRNRPTCVPLGPVRPELHIIRTDFRPQKMWPLFEWSSPDAGRLEPANANELTVLARRAIERRPERSLAVITKRMVTAPLVPGQTPKDCGILTFTTPSVVGDVAFVERSYTCPGLCGQGQLYALQRSKGQWTVIAMTFLWAS